MAIDSRLLDCDGEPEFTENFNRLLALIDTTNTALGTLTAVVEAIRDNLLLQVTFDSDGGSTVATQNVQYGNTATTPTPPTKEGYTFASWNLGEEVFDFTNEIIVHTALKAIWTEEVPEGGA
jgi:hypothetical protein